MGFGDHIPRTWELEILELGLSSFFLGSAFTWSDPLACSLDMMGTLPSQVVHLLRTCQDAHV